MESTILNGSSFNKALHDGVLLEVQILKLKKLQIVSESEKLHELKHPSGNAARALAASSKSEGLELTSLYTKVGMGDGQQANNPWLQEFPDPITRASWDNYLTISKADADEKVCLTNTHVANGALNGSYANVTANGVSIKGTCYDSARSSKRFCWISLRIW